ncbi:MAG: Triosephosphate isomerase [Patescibacteria group bacterium]|jgi:triosephosphate isomerase|nr:Triosephosphate isomerase [Patescibacteria group bacterium]
MKKSKKLVVGNWKMNPQSLDEAKKLAQAVKRATRGLKKTDVVVCPPFVFLSPLTSLSDSPFFLGAQNANYEAQGPFTGEVSYTELSDFKVDYVIVGHSERRKMGESDDLINKKVRAVVGGGMIAILCVGEEARDSNGDFYNFIKHQITSGLKDVSKKMLDRVVVAYEPLWAIGARESMSPRDLLETSIFIKKVLKDLCGTFSDSMKILYGGDVDRVNADSLVRDGNVSGLLVGRESLRSKDFIEIIKLVDSI